MFTNTRRFNAHGFTLIEIIITIVVLAIAATTLLSVFTSTARTSADPMIQQQAISIAEAYMEEIVSKSFNDPQGDEEVEVAEEETDEEVEVAEEETDEEVEVAEKETRANYDDVQDYNSLPENDVVKDQNNEKIDQLSADYKVTVKVFGEALGTALNEISGDHSMRIDITVSHPAISPITITGYRTDY
jgi:MSHA pilin protein MshD